ncbi:MAG: NADP-dependent oxidoreductase [Acidimicrobiales bacterium]
MSAQKLVPALLAVKRGVPQEVLRYGEIPMPALCIGDVLVRVEAASFTPTELEWPSTGVDRSGREKLPVVPGHEVSGTVIGLGYGTTGLAVGDEVFGLTDWYRDGSLAEYVAVEERDLARKPATLDHVDAAAIALAGLTAWQALFVHARLEAGQQVMILGAGGGVGAIAVQLARTGGVGVIGAGRATARELVLELGAERFVDIENESVDVAGKVDAVFDLVGGEHLRSSVRVVRDGGTVVSAVEAITPSPAGVNAVFFVVEPDRTQLSELGGRVANGAVRAVLGQVGALRDGVDIWAAKVAGAVPGKFVLRPNHPSP